MPPIAVIFSEHRTQHVRCPRVASDRGQAPRGGRRLAVRDRRAGGGRDVDRPQPGLAARHVRAGVGAVRAGDVGRRGRCDLPARRGRASRAARALVEKVLAPAVNVDETGWYTAHDPRTLWTATTPEAAIFKIMEDRHRDRLKKLIGKDFKGILGSDRWWAYDHIDPESRQACWEHLKRDFFRHSEGLAEQKEFGTAGLQLTKRLFKTWRSFQEHQDRARLIREMKPIQDELRTLVEHAAPKSPRTRLHRRFANNLLKIWPAL